MARRRHARALRRRYGRAKTTKAWAVLYPGTNDGYAFTSKTDANRFLAERRRAGDRMSSPRPMTDGEVAGVNGWSSGQGHKGLFARLSS